MRFSRFELDRFGQLSFDQNPLHVSADYARTTPYGERVVFGILGTLVTLAHLPEREGETLAELAADFHNPLFADVDYAVEVTNQPGRSVATVLDGRDLLLRLTATFRQGEPVDYGHAPAVAPPRSEPARLDSSQVSTAAASEGTYRPSPDDVAQFVKEWHLRQRGVGPMHVAAMLWSSYFVGMELPGERALFSRLRLAFSSAPTDGGVIEYRATVAAFDERFNLARIAGELSVQGRPLASAELRALVRDDLPGRGADELLRLLPRSQALAGKVALVTGGSRGLGARIVQALASQGSTVLANFLRGRAEFERMASEVPGTTDRIIPAQGDAADPEWCAQTREKANREFGGLDVLVCNAALPLRSMSVQPNFAERISSYIAKSVALVAGPMGSFIELLDARDGTVVVISSSAVEHPPSDWPHYVSAKAAVEALTAVVALQYPRVRFLVVRPPRLLTDLTNTPSPSTRQGALRPEVAAAATALRLLSPLEPGRVEILRDITE